MSAIAIVGMHRSGTSVFAHFLHEAGLFLGEDLYQNYGDNPKGHWEDNDFVNLHRNACLGHGQREEYLVTQSFDLPDDTRSAMQALWRHKQLSTNGTRWGWKEPRTTLFLPTWFEIAPELRVIGLFRNPKAVVSSLCKRHNAFYKPRWVSLFYNTYYHYNNCLLEASKRFPNQVALIPFDDFQANPEAYFPSLEQHTGLTLNRELWDRTYTAVLHRKKREVLPFLAPLAKHRANRIFNQLLLQVS